MNIVLIGAPLSGKGTQAQLISKHFGLQHISMGELFREQMSQNTPLSSLVKSYAQNAQLVPDDITIKVLKAKLSSLTASNGVLLDGFPRTLFQAKKLDGILQVDMAIYIKTDLNTVLDRLKNRYVCTSCGATNIAKNELIPCSSCGGKLVKRLDDTEQIVRERFKQFEFITHQVVEFYDLAKKLKRVDGNQTMQQVFESIKILLEAL